MQGTALCQCRTSDSDSQATDHKRNKEASHWKPPAKETPQYRTILMADYCHKYHVANGCHSKGATQYSKGPVGIERGQYRCKVHLHIAA